MTDAATRPSPTELRRYGRPVNPCRIQDEHGVLGVLLAWDAAHALEALDEPTTMQLVVGDPDGRWVSVQRHDTDQVVLCAFDAAVPVGSVVLSGWPVEDSTRILAALVDDLLA